MKKIITDNEMEGLEKLLGEKVTLYCDTYIYSGTLKGVDETCVLLANTEIVYDTGSHDTTEWSVSGAMPHDWYVMLSKIESFGIYK